MLKSDFREIASLAAYRLGCRGAGGAGGGEPGWRGSSGVTGPPTNWLPFVLVAGLLMIRPGRQR
jgi:hypothetical protein